MYRIASHAQRFKELVGSDAEPETMEEKITLALGSVLPCSPIPEATDCIDDVKERRQKLRRHQQPLVDITPNFRLL